MDMFEKDLPEQENGPETNETVEEAVTEVAETAEEAVTEAAEEKAESVKEPAKPKAPVVQETSKKKSALRVLRSEKFKRGGMATMLTVIFVAVVVVINVLVSALSARFPSMNIDLTAQKLNTLSEQAQEVAKGVSNRTEIFLIGSEDAFRKDELYSSYGFEFSQVANLADRLAEINPLISVEFIDKDLNPDFVTQYSSDTLNNGCVLVRTEKRHKVVQPSDMFELHNNSTGTGYDIYTNVDSCLAGALEIVNMEKVPVIAVAVGSHKEMLDGSLTQFYTLMERQNYEVVEFNLFTEEIPENTQLIMLPTPNSDYDEGEIQKLRAFITDEDRRENLNILVTCFPTQGELPHLASFLEEWGVRVEKGTVFETDPSRKASYNENLILAEYNDKVVDNNYKYLMAGYSSPITILFEGNGDVGVRPLWTTAETAYVVDDSTTEAQLANPVTGVYNVATLSGRILQMEDYETFRRNVMVFGSSVIFADSYITSSAFDNSRYMEDLMRYATGTGGSSVTVYTNPTQTNTLDISMSASLVTTLGLGVFTAGLPLAILVIGLAVFLKRRHL